MPYELLMIPVFLFGVGAAAILWERDRRNKCESRLSSLSEESDINAVFRLQPWVALSASGRFIAFIKADATQKVSVFDLIECVPRFVTETQKDGALTTTYIVDIRVRDLDRPNIAVRCPSHERASELIASINALCRIIEAEDARLNRHREFLVLPASDDPNSDSIEDWAKPLTDRCLTNAQRFLEEGHNWQAVSEMLWLLETISSSFKGMPTKRGAITGDNFNQIAKSLRARYRGETLEEVLGWIERLHYYLSSQEGGVRHGANINSYADMPPGEARLFCALLQSYTLYLMAEHDRLKETREASFV